MTSIDEEPQAPLAELAGYEPSFAAMVPIPVVVQGPVMTEERASTFGGMNTEVALGATARCVLRADPRRRKATLIGITQAVRVGRAQSQAEQAGAVWPSAVALVITSRDEVWVSCATAGQVTDLSVIVERWA